MASSKFSIEGSSIDNGIVTVTAGTVVNLAVLDVAGLESITWSCVGTHEAVTTPASITALISTAGTPDGATASFTMPAGAGQCYRIRCRAVDANGNVLNSFGLVGVLNASGIAPFAAGEENERDLVQGWTDAINNIASAQINASQFGVSPESADNTAAIESVFAAAIAAGGGRIYFDQGDYKIAGAGADAGGVQVELTASVLVECHPAARFFTDSLDNDMFRFTVPVDGAGLPADKITFDWVGGIFDQRNQKNSTSIPHSGTYPGANVGSSATTDALSLRFAYESDAAQVWQVDDSISAFVDETADFNNATDADVTPFPASEAVGDYFAIGLASQFTNIVFDYANGTAGVGGVVAWEYWNGSTWAALPGLTDATAGFTTAVADALAVTWNLPDDWATTSLNGSAQLFYVRARVTTVYSTNPVLDEGHVAVSNGCARASVTGARFIAGTHWETAGGDSGIFIGTGTDLSVVEGCTFLASRDLGVYATRDALGIAGGSVIFRDNHFESCMFGCAVKRSFAGFAVHGNTFVNCTVGFQTNEVTGPSSHGAVLANRFEKCTYFVRLVRSVNVRIFGNYAVSIGATDGDGTTVFTPYAGGVPAGYVFEGAQYCSVDHEACRVIAPAAASSNPRLVMLDDDSATSTLSEFNIITDCISEDFSRVVEELSASADNNRVERCYNYGTAGLRDPVTVGTGSSIIRWVPAQNAWSFEEPLLFGDGSSSNPAVARRANPAAGLYFTTNYIGSSQPFATSVGSATAPAHTFSAETGLGMYRVGSTRLGFASNGAKRAEIDDEGLIEVLVASVTDPANNFEMRTELTSNTQLTFKVKGSDGTVRSVTLTLA